MCSAAAEPPLGGSSIQARLFIGRSVCVLLRPPVSVETGVASFTTMAVFCEVASLSGKGHRRSQSQERQIRYNSFFTLVKDISMCLFFNIQPLTEEGFIVDLIIHE